MTQRRNSWLIGFIFCSILLAPAVSAGTIAKWTFAERSPALPSFWFGQSSPQISSDIGNGILETYTATGWREGSWYHNLSSGYSSDGTGALGLSLFNSRSASMEFTVSTLGQEGIQVSGAFSRVGNPSLNAWSLSYSLDDGQSFVSAGTMLWPRGWSSYTWDLSGVTALDNQNSVLVRMNTRAPNTVADWTMSGMVDDLTVSSSSSSFVVPEPSSGMMLCLAGVGYLGTCRRRRAKRD